MDSGRCCNVKIFAASVGAICVIFSSFGYFKSEVVALGIIWIQQVFFKTVCDTTAINVNASEHIPRSIQCVLLLECVLSMFLIYGAIMSEPKFMSPWLLFNGIILIVAFPLAILSIPYFIWWHIRLAQQKITDDIATEASQPSIAVSQPVVKSPRNIPFSTNGCSSNPTAPQFFKNSP